MADKTYINIKADLLKGTIHPLYFFYGSEAYFIDDLAKVAEQHILQPGEEAFNKAVFYGRDSNAGQIVDQVRRFPMMAERQLVILKEAQALTDFDKLLPVFKNPVPTTVFVVVYKKEKIDKRMSIFKSINENAIVLESKKLYENKVPIWLNGYLKDRNLKLSPRAIQLLIEYLGADLEKLTNAVDKLEIASPSKDIPDELVEVTIGINRNYNVFELQESLGQRNISDVLKIAGVMEQDLKHNPMQMVIPSLFNYLSKLYMIKPLGNNMSEIKRVIRIRSDFIIQKYISASKKYTIGELEHMIHTLKIFDVKSKGVGVRELSAEELFNEMMLRLVHMK